MNSSRLVSVARWSGTALALAAIVAFYRLLFHANQTTVALSMLLLVLFVAANWGLRLAVVCSFVAAGCYNYFFLPPLGSFAVEDPQNLIAIAVFLITSVTASRLSHRILEESRQARRRRAELEVLYSLSRGLLQTDELTQMTNAIPTAVMSATSCHSVLFYFSHNNRVYRAGVDWSLDASSPQLKELCTALGVYTTTDGAEVIPLRTGVRPQGVLVLQGAHLSTQTLEAIGGLVSVSLDRATALESVTHESLLREGERLRSSILDSITQDLRTPVTLIKDAVSALMASHLGAEDSLELLTIADEESDRLNQIIVETVELARFDSQQASVDARPADLRSVVRLALDLLSEKLLGRDITLRLPSSLPPVMVDSTLIQKVIAHLVHNAATYSSTSEPIFISAESDGQNIACSIADRGTGISKEEQTAIFDRLYKLRGQKGRRSNSGMSLAICRAIMQAHHGSISVTSQPGRGSVFTLLLPQA